MHASTRTRTRAVAAPEELLLGGAAALAAGDSMDASDTSRMSKDSTSKGAMLEIENQAVADDSVVVDALYRPRDVLVVVHAADADGELEAPESIGHRMV